MVCNMVLGNSLYTLFFATSHHLLKGSERRFSNIRGFPISFRRFSQFKKWDPSGKWCGAMPNHHPINTFMESCSYWKVLPQAHEESFCLLTSQRYYCLIFYPLNEMEKQRKTVQTFSHQDQKRRFSDFIILLSKKFCSHRLRDSRQNCCER